MEAITQTVATVDQIRHINRLGSDAIAKVLSRITLSKVGAQRVIEQGDQFVDNVSGAVISSLERLSPSDKFKDEEVGSSYEYPSEYKLKSIAEQVRILRQFFPGIGSADETLAEQSVPVEVEGLFAIPRWRMIAPTYEKAVEQVFVNLMRIYKGAFRNRFPLSLNCLRQTKRTEKMFQVLGDQQKDNDILIVGAQFGLRHRGRSVRRVREVMNSNEFGLGSFAVATMLLTHPERMMRDGHLFLNCVGDECAVNIESEFWYVPVFFKDSTNYVRFNVHGHDSFSENFGSVSGFLPSVSNEFVL